MKNIKKHVSIYSANKNWSPGHPEDALLQILRTSPKDPIWPSRERPDMMSWGRPEMTFRGHPNLTSNERPWEVGSEHTHDVFRTSPSGLSKHVFGTMWVICSMSLIFCYFSFRTYSIDQIYLKEIQYSRYI